MALYRWLALCFCAICLIPGSANAQYGVQFSGIGPINRSMGGTSTAAPLDTLGALYWNPATITALPNSTDFGLELLVGQTKLSSSIQAGPINVSGSTNSNAGVFPLPNFGVVFTPKDSAFTYGLGVLTVAGFGTNYPGDASNPVLSPNPPAGFGVGPIYSQYAVMQLVPTISAKITEKLSFGVSPIVDLATLSLNPGFLADPNGPNNFPAMTSGQYQWGMGIQAGVYYITDSDWQFGASIKSPQWFNHFGFNSKDQQGNAEYLKTAVNSPMIVSLGTAYTGFERILLALDGRFLDYHNTVPLSDAGLSPTGATTGLGWNSIFAVSTGAQYKLTETVSVRGGYSFNTNPIPNENSFYNVASPTVLQHGIYCGTSYNFTQNFKVSLAYTHCFANSVSGPFISPTGPVPGTSVSSQSSANALTAGASFLF